MAYLVGTDEAGYAPNLGPLVISATVWQVPDPASDIHLYKTLRRVVCNSPGHAARCRRVSIGDSKVLYRAGEGLRLLECGVLGVLRAAGVRAHRWRDLWDALDPGAKHSLDALPWYIGFDGPAPCNTTAAELDRACRRLQRGFQQAHVRCHTIRSRAVFPQEFNDAVDRYGSKGEALSQLTLDLIQQVLPLQSELTIVHCDKHGGRNRYGALLQQQFPDYLVEVRRESRAESVYTWGPRERRIEFRFAAGGERSLPSALASMASKYLRELALQAFNHFWRCHLPQLKPTAGYPGDSRRFKADIASVQQSLGIDDHLLWRKR